MKVVSFFSGCGGLDLGFEQAGFDVIWANDNDKAVHETYMLNHPNTYLCKDDMRSLSAHDIPECDGFIGAPLLAILSVCMSSFCKKYSSFCG